MERALIGYIANALWQIPLLALGAWLLLRAVKAPPPAQHSLWLAVLALAVLLPALGIRQPAAPLIPAQPAAAAVQLPLPAPGAEPTGLAVNPARPTQKRWLRLAAQALRVPITPAVAHLVAALYLAMTLFGLVRIALAWRAAQRLVIQSQPATLSPCHMEALGSYGRRLQTKVPQLRESSAVSSPLIVGVSSAVLLLPPDFARHTEDEIAAALCHELAHLRRHDYLVNLICRLASLPVAWHPATHAVQRRIRRTREMVCDAIAARLMCSEIKYAKCLVALAQSMLHGPALQERAQAPGLFSKDTLEERVMRLMEKNSVLSLRARVARAAAGAAVMAATILLAAVVHVTPVMAAPVTQSAVVQSPVTQSPVADANAAPLPQESPSAAPPTAAAPSASPDPPAAARGDEAGDQATVEQKNESHVHRGPQDDGTLVLDLDTAHCKLTPEERLQIQQQLDDALQQLRDTKDALNHGDLKRQMDDVHGRMADTQAMLSRPEFKKQMEDAARQAKQQAKEFALRGEEFKKQMADLQTKLQSGEFQEQIAAAKRQAADAALHGEEFKKQMQELQQLRSEEFKRAMEQAAQALKDAEEQFKNKSVH